MPKRPQSTSRSAQASGGKWSIVSGGLTPAGRTEILRHLGSRMREDYQQVVSEPVPDDLERLVGKLKRRERTKVPDQS